MKKLVSLIFLLVFAIPFTYAQDPTEEPLADDDPATIAYGETVSGEITDREFEIEHYFQGVAGEVRRLAAHRPHHREPGNLLLELPLRRAEHRSLLHAFLCMKHRGAVNRRLRQQRLQSGDLRVGIGADEQAGDGGAVARRLRELRVDERTLVDRGGACAERRVS